MKVLCTAAVLLSCAIAAGGANADPYIPGLYTVINYSAAFPDYRKIPDISLPSELDGVEADIGWRFNRFYSVEASYSYFTGQRTGNGQSITTTLQDGSLDALGYLPLGWSSPWALYDDISGTYYFASANTATTSFSNESKFGARAGGGLQYMIDEDLGVRLSGRYDWADLSHMRSAEVFTIGLVWQR
jgi:hypothetical protein